MAKQHRTKCSPLHAVQLTKIAVAQATPQHCAKHSLQIAVAQATPQSIPANAFDDAVFGWVAPEYLRYDRGWLWFVAMGAVNALLVWYAYISGSLTMAAVFLILPWVLILEHRKKPKAVDVIFSHYGIKFGGVKIPYSGIRAFWILHNPPFVDELHLKTNRKAHPEIVIPLMGMNPAHIRQFLVTQIVEWEGKELPLLDTIVRILRLN